MHDLYIELKFQFGKKDADMMLLAPRKYVHHFNDRTLKAYKKYLKDNQHN